VNLIRSGANALMYQNSGAQGLENSRTANGGRRKPAKNESRIRIPMSKKENGKRKVGKREM